MKSRLVQVAIGIALVLIVVATLHALAQPGGGFGGGGGAGGFGPMMMPGWPPAPTPVVVIEDGAVYVACDGVLMAYEAKTLKPLGQTIYWERPAPVE